MSTEATHFVSLGFNGEMYSIPIVNIGLDRNGNRKYMVKGSYLGIEPHHEYDRSVKIPNLIRCRKKDLYHYFVFQSAYPNEDLLFMLKSVEQFYNKLKAKEPKQT